MNGAQRRNRGATRALFPSEEASIRRQPTPEPPVDDVDAEVAGHVADPVGWGGGHDGLVAVPSGVYLDLVKPAADRVASAVLLVAFAPVFAAVALTIRVTMGPGVVYRQRRVGKGGRVFVIYKFRTMKHSRRRESRAYDGPDRRRTHKTTADPRHTRVGRFLRSSSLDELPQLVNVLKGEMSLVGPRPELEEVVEKYGLWNHPRHLVRPGITGLWQVSELREELLHECVHVDTDYVRGVGPRMDLDILVQTFSSVANRSGA